MLFSDIAVCNIDILCAWKEFKLHLRTMSQLVHFMRYCVLKIFRENDTLVALRLLDVMQLVLFSDPICSIVYKCAYAL